MKCIKCGKEIYRGRGGFYFHAGSDNISCCPDDVATPTFMVGETRSVPLINPLRIPIDWWGIATDENGYRKKWYMFKAHPGLSCDIWNASGDECVRIGIVDWEGDWKESAFTREEIQARWEKEYGCRWYDKAMENAK